MASVRKNDPLNTPLTGGDSKKEKNQYSKEEESNSHSKRDSNFKDSSSSLGNTLNLVGKTGNPLGSYCSVKLSHENYLL